MYINTGQHVEPVLLGVCGAQCSLIRPQAVLRQHLTLGSQQSRKLLAIYL
jgi:hypothetical protein